VKTDCTICPGRNVFGDALAARNRRAIQFWSSYIDVVNGLTGTRGTWILAKAGLAQADQDACDYGNCEAMLAEAQARSQRR
jgi:hypothetical protein